MNKGEWSEFYVLVKLLADGELSPADADFEKLTDVIYPILKIIRHYKVGVSQEYKLNDSVVIIESEDGETTSVPIGEFEKFSTSLLKGIREGKGSSFPIEGANEFLEKINCPSVKASSTDKSDIHIVVHDQRTGHTPKLGFSIKSQLGKASTLLNAGKTTNFIYKLSDVNLSADDVRSINSIVNKKGKTDVKARLNALNKLGVKLDFSKTENHCFGNNLRLIDTGMPLLLSKMLLEYYSNRTTGVLENIEKVETQNVLDLDSSAGHKFYLYKIKKLLMDVALGMMPSKVWNGQADANGGYIIIRQDGEIICYHLYDRNLFENYLVANTRFDTPSSSRFGFGEVFEANEEHFFKLCMQIRFKK